MSIPARRAIDYKIDMAQFCIQCGAGLADGSSFCHQCGTKRGAAGGGAAIPRPVPLKDEPEIDLWKSTPSARAWAHYWLLCILILLVSAYLTITQVIAWHWALTAAAAPLLYTLWIIAVAKVSTRYRLTNQRIFVERGILTRKISETELIRIDDVAVTQNLLQRMFRVGVITLSAADADESIVRLEGIDNPVDVKETIRGLVRKQQSRVLRTQAV